MTVIRVDNQLIVCYSTYSNQGEYIMRYLNERDEDWEDWTDALAETYQSQREDEEREYARQYVDEHSNITEGNDND